MQRKIITVPRSLFRVLDVNWDIDWRGQSAGASTDGVTRTTYNAFPRWVGSPSIVLGREWVSQWRAIRGAAQGMVNLYRLPMVDPVCGVFGSVSDQVQYQGLPFSTDQRFSTGYGFEYAPFIYAKAASRGDTVLRLVIASDGDVPRVGQFISHDDYPYMVTSITPDVSGGIEVGIQMPLRQKIPVGAEIQLAAYGVFEAAEEGMGNPAYGLDLVSRPRLSFREWLR